MDLKSDRELECTREKLRLLQEHYEASRLETDGHEFARTLSLRSLKRMINQLTEEIVRYESRAKTASRQKAS